MVIAKNNDNNCYLPEDAFSENDFAISDANGWNMDEMALLLAAKAAAAWLFDIELIVEFTCKPTCILAADMNAAAAGELKYEIRPLGGEPSSLPKQWFVVEWWWWCSNEGCDSTGEVDEEGK